MPTYALAGVTHIHTPGFVKKLLARPDAHVAAVWDPDPARGAPVAAQLQAPLADRAEELWQSSTVDAVIVCSETGRHEELAVPAAEAGKHLFVEKPLGFAAVDARRIATAVEKAGVLFQTGYFMRGDPVHQFLRGALQRGEFGTVTRARHSNCHSGSLGGWFDTDWRWMADPARAGCGAFGDLGTHSLDILLWLFGEVEAVSATLRGVTGRYGDCDETGEGLLRFRSGVVASLAAAWLDVANPVSVLVSGTEGHAHTHLGQLYFKSAKVEGADGKTPWSTLPTAWPHAFDLFLDAVAGRPGLPLVGVREAAVRSAVMEALYSSARSGRWVEVPV